MPVPPRGGPILPPGGDDRVPYRTTSDLVVTSTDPAAPDPVSRVDELDLPPAAHTTHPGGSAARCGNLGGPLVPWERVVDPADYEAVFDCPGCWSDAAGGAEPMGGGHP